MTEKYLARLILAKHPEIDDDPHYDDGTTDNDVVMAYMLNSYFGECHVFDENTFPDIIAKSETLDDFNHECCKLIAANRR